MHERDIEEYFVALMGGEAESAAAPTRRKGRERGVVVVLSMLRLMLFRMQKDFTFVLFAFFIIALAVFFPLFAGLSKVFPLNIVVVKAPAGRKRLATLSA